MPPLNKFLKLFKLLISLISLFLIFLLIVITYSLIFILVPINNILKPILVVVICILIGHFTFLLWKKIFSWNKVSTNIARAVILSMALILPSWIFVFPIKVPEKLEKRPPHTLIDVDKKGNQVAFFEMKSKEPKTTTPILFIVGGPGGSVDNFTFDFLKKYTDLGIDVYTYDPLGNMESPRAKNPKEDYTIEKEVERIHAVVKKIGSEKVILMGHSFGGNLSARYINKYPETVAKYIAIDTAPIYSTSGNTRKESEKYLLQQQDNQNINFPKIQLSLREKIRVGVGHISSAILKTPPYGNKEEYDYLLNKFTDGFHRPEESITCKNEPKVSDNDKGSVYPSLETFAALDADLKKTPDFTHELKEKSKDIPVLLFHPECGVVPWEIHVAYKEFFSDVKIIAVPKAGHGIWDTVSGEKMLLDNAAAFIFNQDISSQVWTDNNNPF